MQRTINMTVNGQQRELEVNDADTLLEVLRDGLKLWSVRESCGVGACGSCTVLLDGRPVSACFLLAARLDGRTIETVEGLGSDDALHPIQQAFLENDAAQCGYCTPGFIMAAKALLEEHGDPSDDQIRDYLSGNLCRCGGYPNIMRAVRARGGSNGRRLRPRRPGSIGEGVLRLRFATLRTNGTGFQDNHGYCPQPRRPDQPS